MEVARVFLPLTKALWAAEESTVLFKGEAIGMATLLQRWPQTHKYRDIQTRVDRLLN